MKMTYDLLQDMADVTTIPKMRLDQLADNAINFIAHYIRESADCGESDLSVDTGIGVMHIRIEDENIKFKFIPSSKLENGIKYAITSGESPLINKVEALLKDRICNTYKDLL